MKAFILGLLISSCVFAQEFPLELEQTIELPGDDGIWDLQYWMYEDSLGWAYLSDSLLSYRPTLAYPIGTYLIADTCDVEGFTTLNLAGEPGVAVAVIGRSVYDGTRNRYMIVINLNSGSVVTSAGSGLENTQAHYIRYTGRLFDNSIKAEPPLPAFSTHVITAVCNRELLSVEGGFNDESGDVFAYDLSSSPMSRVRMGPGYYIVPFRPVSETLYAMAGYDVHIASPGWGTRSFVVGGVNHTQVPEVDLGCGDDIATCVNMGSPHAWQNADGSRRVAILGQVYDGNTGELLPDANTQFPSIARIAILDSTGNELMITWHGQVYDPETGEALGTTSAFTIRRVIKRADGIDRLVSSDHEGEVRVYRSALLTTDSPHQEPSEIPNGFSLSAFPNPFNPTTTISYSLPFAARGKLDVFNVMGQNVTQTDLGLLDAGAHSYVFDASALPSGIYFARLSTPQFNKSVKLLLTK